MLCRVVWKGDVSEVLLESDSLNTFSMSSKQSPSVCMNVLEGGGGAGPIICCCGTQPPTLPLFEKRDEFDEPRPLLFETFVREYPPRCFSNSDEIVIGSMLLVVEVENDRGRAIGPKGLGLLTLAAAAEEVICETS